MKFRTTLAGAVVWTCLSAIAVEIHAPTGSCGVCWFEDVVTRPDGVTLYTYGAAPAGGGKHPVVISRSPYVPRKRANITAFAKSERAFLARGYARIYQHCRGTGLSGGVRTPYDDERADGLALLDYVRAHPWYNGEIFLVGSSYNATAHYAVLASAPADVKGAALYVQDVNRYNIAYRNGFFKIGLHGGWYLSEYRKNDTALTRNKAVTFFQFPLCDFPKRYWGRNEPSMENVLRHPRADDPFWRSEAPGSGADCRGALLKTTIPILLKGSFYDIYTDGVCEMWRELPPARRANCAFLIDACGHNGRPSPALDGTRAVFPGGARKDAGVEAEDWFDFVRTGRPPANAPLGKTRYYALWENVWHTEEELTDGPRTLRLPLGTGEHTYVYDPLRPLPVFPGSGGICFGGMQVQPPPAFRDDVLSFVLPPLAETLDVRGRMEAELTVSSDREDTSFYIRVSVDKGDGKWLLLRDDITSLARTAPYLPGARRQLRFRFADHAFRLSPGDRLRVDVAGANAQFAPHPNVAGDAFAVTAPQTARNNVIADGSRLILHVLDARP